VYQCRVCNEYFAEPAQGNPHVEWDDAYGTPVARTVYVSCCPCCGAEDECLIEIEEEEPDFKRDQLDEIKPLLKDAG
jgi:hypothetical protein